MTEGSHNRSRAHWDSRYRTDETRLSWFEETPRRSLEMVEAAAPHRGAAIIDVGGGASRLVDALLDRGYSDLTVLDVSQAALSLARDRLELRAASPVSLLAADVTRWVPDRRWDVWHDRALFHFLVEEDAQKAYLAALMHATVPGAHAIIASFAPSGPERCSGLPVRRYDGRSLAKRLGRRFALEHQALETHRTPAGKRQDFLYAVFVRR
ncbi:MAG: class I SAM-dependent methyltransferase [Rhizomicrobium sp.]